MNADETKVLFSNYMKSKYGENWELMFTAEAHEAYYDCWLSGFYTGVRVARNSQDEKDTSGNL